MLRPLWTTSLVKRLADGFITLYSNSDLKKYDNKSPLFNDLPMEISRVLLHDFENLISSDFSLITDMDKFEIPKGIPLFQTEDDDPILDDDSDKFPEFNILNNDSTSTAEDNNFDARLENNKTNPLPQTDNTVNTQTVDLQQNSQPENKKLRDDILEDFSELIQNPYEEKDKILQMDSESDDDTEQNDAMTLRNKKLVHFKP